MAATVTTDGDTDGDTDSGTTGGGNGQGTASDNGQLPFTGAGVAGPALLGGLGLVAAGALFLVVGRRRGTATS